MHKRNAFTIVELLVVIIVIGILVVLSIIGYSSISQKATVSSLQSDLSNAKKQLLNFQSTSSTNSFPTAINCSSPSATELCVKFTGSNIPKYYVNNNSPAPSFLLSVSNSNNYYQVTESSAVSSSIITNGLMFNLDASIPASYPGSGTTWYDISGAGNNTTLSGLYSYQVGPSLRFNEGSQLNGTGRATVDFGTVATSSAYTIECVFKINRYAFLSAYNNMTAQLFSSGRSPTKYLRSFYLGRNNVVGEIVGMGMAWYDVNNSDGPGGWSNDILTNQIYHLAVTIENPGNVRFYRNGSQFSASSSSQSNLKLNSIWSVANQPPGSDEGVDSNFYAVRAYNRVLSAAEISQNFNATRSLYGL